LPLLYATAVHHTQAACRHPIRAELIGSDRCATLNITAISTTPVLAMCCQLINAGHDPDRPLHVYRKNTLALRVRSIGEAAALEINSKGTGFIKCRHAVRTAPPVAQLGQIVSRTLAGAGS
jgi:hypothetical protein